MIFPTSMLSISMNDIVTRSHALFSVFFVDIRVDTMQESLKIILTALRVRVRFLSNSIFLMGHRLAARQKFLL